LDPELSHRAGSEIPVDHNGPLQQVADGDVAVAMVVEHIMNSPV